MKRVHFITLIFGALFFFQTVSFPQWISLDAPSSPVYDLTASDTNMFAGCGNGVYLSTNNGKSWSPIFNLENYIVYSLLMLNTNLFIGTSNSQIFPNGGVFLSTNYGANWTKVASGLPKSNIYALATIDTNLFAGSEEGIFLSTNNGTSWTPVNNELTSLYINTFAVSGKNLFAGTNQGIFRSTDNGTVWTKTNTGLTSLFIHSLFVCDTNIFAGTMYGGVFLSTNNGTSWIENNTGMPTNITVYDFSVYEKSLFASSDSGVFRSTNNGSSWTNVSDGLPTPGLYSSRTVYSLAVCGTDLFAGTSMNQVYKRPLSELVTSVEHPFFHYPDNYNLLQNYPNPFNPSTNFEFRIAEAGFVSLKIFDELGREIAIIVSEELNAGNYLRQWNAGHLPSGIYFCRLQVGLFSQTKKLMLLK